MQIKYNVPICHLTDACSRWQDDWGQNEFQAYSTVPSSLSCPHPSWPTPHLPILPAPLWPHFAFFGKTPLPFSAICFSSREYTLYSLFPPALPTSQVTPNRTNRTTSGSAPPSIKFWTCWLKPHCTVSSGCPMSSSNSVTTRVHRSYSIPFLASAPNSLNSTVSNFHTHSSTSQSPCMGRILRWPQQASSLWNPSTE